MKISVEQPSLATLLLNLIFFHRWTFGKGQPLMGVSTLTAGTVTQATVAIPPVLRGVYLTGAPVHHNTTGNGVKLKQSLQLLSRVTNLFKGGRLFFFFNLLDIVAAV